jgi:hypothetical protein
VGDRLRVNPSSPYVYFRYTPCLTDFTFEFIRRPTSPILSPSYWTFVEITLVRSGQVQYKLQCPYMISTRISTMPMIGPTLTGLRGTKITGSVSYTLVTHLP